MIELDLNNPLSNIRACRRIVLQEGTDPESLDSHWREKLRLGSGMGKRDDIILSNPRTKVPKGFAVVTQMEDGQDMGFPISTFNGERQRAVHICHGHGIFSYDGMKYKWIPVEEGR